MSTRRLILPATATALFALACAAQSAEPSARQVAVDSNAAWQGSGVHLSAGQALRISAAGEYVFHAAGHSTGPSGIPEAEPFSGSWPADGLPGLALVGRVGASGVPFLVGDLVERRADAGGELMFMVNDDILTENEGVLRVTVEILEGGGATAEQEPPSDAPDAPDATPTGTQEGVLEIATVGLRMRYPAAWSEGGISGETVLASFSGGSGLYPGLNVTLERHDDSRPEAVTDAWVGLLSGATVNAREDIEVSGRPAVLTDVSWSSLLGSLRAMRLIIGRGDDVLVITFADRDDDVTDAVAEAYRGFLSSVTLDTPE